MSHYKIGTILFLILFSTYSVFAARGPKILSPVNNKSITQTSVVLIWEELNRTNIIYEVKVSESPDFLDDLSLVLQTTKNKITINYPFFELGKRYFWTVKGMYTNNGTVYINTDWSHEKQKIQSDYSFVIAEDAIDLAGEQPKMLLDEEQMAYDTLQPVLKWDFWKLKNEPYKILNKDGVFVEPILSKISYDFQISEASDFSVGTRTYSPILGDSIIIKMPILYPNHEYFCRVRAKYYDPILKIVRTTRWSSEFNGWHSFKTSIDALGTFSFSEGSILEQNMGDLINYSLELLVSGNYNNISPSVSMNGQMLSFISDRSGNRELYLKDTYARRNGGETQKTQIMSGRSIYNPFWLNDDERVGFFANLYNPMSWHVFSTNRGSGLTIMTSGMEMAEKNPDFSLSGSCSTDGRVIFSAKMYDSDPYMMYLLDLSDDSRTQLRPGLFPDIRDDDRIVFCSNETGNYEIWIVELEGKSVFRPTILNSHQADDYEPAFSPNGERILFTSNRSGNSDIWVMDVDGSNLQQLTTHPMVDRHPQWIDASTIVFQSNRDKDDRGNPIYGIYLLRLSN
ncbi:hypothetical protein [Carboxylicivirga caseinilyticus]|uniref:TolB family protein n=1 Tax=Carboxylicivirga caseinilyticus TaxID=3417572 RepID=UPI003D335523|nr:PD40 domain-containing protein [Marinilabiliaceae bacterium A049]